MAGERWDRNRLMYERDRLEDERSRMRGARSRDPSDERFDRPRFHDDHLGRDSRYADDEPRRERADFDRRATLEKQRDGGYSRDGSPRRPAYLRRQSSLDTFDRRPLRAFHDGDEYPPPARREDVYRDDYRAPAYTPIPLPKTRALPPPRTYADRGGFYDDAAYAADPDRYAVDDFRPYPERVREREVVRERQLRDRSRESRTTRTRTHRSASRSSSTSRSSSAGGTTVRSQYPRRGKTKIPARLVSKRALIDLGYPFIEEGNTVIVQKALGQDNIDELLKLSEEYNKADQEVAAAQSLAGNLMEERREELYLPPAPAPATVPPPASRAATAVPLSPAAPPPPTVALPSPVVPRSPVVAAPPPATAPLPHFAPPPPPPQPPVEVVERARTVIRDVSPARTATTSTSSSSWDSHHYRHHYPHHHHHHHHDDVIVGPVIHRSRSRSRSGREIRAEIRALERELAHRPKGELGEREVVRTERLPDGELIVYQEKVERQVAGPKPPRIEKDKKGPPPMLLKAMLGTLT